MIIYIYNHIYIYTYDLSVAQHKQKTLFFIHVFLGVPFSNIASAEWGIDGQLGRHHT
jgi:hypothetical protein